MPERVSEGFLNNTVAGEFEACGKNASGSLDFEADGQSCFLDRFDDGAYVGEGRLGISITATVTQHSKDRSQLLHSPPTGLPDSLQSTDCAIRGSLNHLACSASLDDHQAHTVGDHVVELPSNTGSLLRLSYRQR